MRLLPLFLLIGCVGPLERFECGGKAIVTVPASRVCDGAIDCWGGQDERQDGCATELFFCDDPEPQALLAEAECDGVEDCSSGIDEQSCDR